MEARKLTPEEKAVALDIREEYSDAKRYPGLSERDQEEMACIDAQVFCNPERFKPILTHLDNPEEGSQGKKRLVQILRDSLSNLTGEKRYIVRISERSVQGESPAKTMYTELFGNIPEADQIPEDQREAYQKKLLEFITNPSFLGKRLWTNTLSHFNNQNSPEMKGTGKLSELSQSVDNGDKYLFREILGNEGKIQDTHNQGKIFCIAGFENDELVFDTNPNRGRNIIRSLRQEHLDLIKNERGLPNSQRTGVSEIVK